MCIVYIVTRRQVYLPDDIYEELRLVSRLTKRPMSEFVRTGLSKVLALPKKKADPFKYFVGKGKTKKKSNALKDFDDYYMNKPI